MDSSKVFFSVGVGIVLGILAVLVSWFLGSESSPLFEYFLHNVWLKNKWLGLNVMVLLVSIVFDVPEGFDYILIFLQWFLIAFMGLVIVKAVRNLISD